MNDFLRRFKKKPETFLILDIGNETVKALVVQKRGDKIAVLDCSLQYFEKFGVFYSRDFEKDILQKAILKAFQGLKQESFKSLPVILGLPANILRAKITHQFFNREDSKKAIKKKEKELIYQTVLKNNKERIFEEFMQEAGILPQEINLLKHEILETKIEGYQVPEIEGFGGSFFEFRILTTFLLKHHLEFFKKTIKELGLNIFEIRHEVEGLIRFLKQRDGLFLDIGGETTQIFLAVEEKLRKIDFFPLGGIIFSQALSERFGLKKDETRRLKESYFKREVSEGVRRRIRETFSFPVQDWFSGLKKTLKDKKELLPSEIFLFGGGSRIQEIEEILTEGNWEDFSLAGSPKVKLLFLKDLKSIEDETKKVDNQQYIPPLLLYYV